MKEEKDIFNNLKKSVNPGVPKDFFENFSSDLMGKIENEEESILNDLNKSEKPDVPADFFDSFPNKITAIASQSNSGRGRIIKMATWASIISVAAVLTVLFWINREDETQGLAENDTIEYIEVEMTDEEYDDYLAYVDENEIIDYMIENDLDDEVEDDDFEDIYDYVGDDLEELYLDL